MAKPCFKPIVLHATTLSNRLLVIALKGVTSRVPDSKLLHEWIKNNVAVVASGNKYFTDLYNQFNKTPMNTFPNLSDAEIDAILKYVEAYQRQLFRLMVGQGL